jgi:hypothetical protein
MTDLLDKSTRGNAAQFFVAGELCRRGYAAVVTMGNTPNTDVLCSNIAGTRFVHIQVKAFRPGTRTCTVGLKAERDCGPNFFWVLVGLPPPGSPSQLEYFVIPASAMAQNVKARHRTWLAAPGARGQVRRDSQIRAVGVLRKDDPTFWGVAEYRDQWACIESQLAV